MIMPRFTIRTALAGVTLCALVFVVVGMAVRGESWAWGITIALVSLLITLLVHAAWFSLVWTFRRLRGETPGPPSQAAVAAMPIVALGQAAQNGSENRGEAQP